MIPHVLRALFAIVLAFGTGPAFADQSSASSPAYVAPRTEWGDPDLRGTWPLQPIWDAGIPLERPSEQAGRGALTDSEYAARLARAEMSDNAYSNDGEGGTIGLAAWLDASRLARRAALVVDPADGRLPALTAEAEKLYAAGRSSWQVNDTLDWVTDLDPFERCITRGFPAIMLPQPYNNGIRVFQAPGFVVLQLETFGPRIIPLGSEAWPVPPRAWHGQSRGHWEGESLVIVTDHIVDGDSATYDTAHRAAGPVPGRGHATLPVGPAARVTERLTRVGGDTITYRMTYEDPAVFTAQWTVDFDWTRDDTYRIFEYGCQEGSTVRNIITADRARRAAASE